MVKGSKYLRNMVEIKEWMEERKTTRPPVACAKDLEEKKLGRALRTIKTNVVNPYNQLKTEEERKELEKEHPYIKEIIAIVREIDENNVPTYVRNALEIKKWMELNQSTKFPSYASKDLKERKLGNALRNARQNLISPYLKLKTKEEREKFKKSHPEVEKVIKIIREAQENKINLRLKQAREIREWMIKNNIKKMPSQSSKDAEERKLYDSYREIAEKIINPYLKLETTEKKEKFKAKHPELEEIMTIMKEIKELCLPVYLRNARKIKGWMRKEKRNIPPSTMSKNRKEKELGWELVNIRRYMINPYLELKTEEERENYREKYPELDEIIKMIYDIDKDNVFARRTIKQKELFSLMKEDIEKRRKLQEARKLEESYEEELKKKKQNKKDDE